MGQGRSSISKVSLVPAYTETMGYVLRQTRCGNCVIGYGSRQRSSMSVGSDRGFIDIGCGIVWRMFGAQKTAERHIIESSPRRFPPGLVL